MKVLSRQLGINCYRLKAALLYVHILPKNCRPSALHSTLPFQEARKKKIRAVHLATILIFLLSSKWMFYIRIYYTGTRHRIKRRDRTFSKEKKTMGMGRYRKAYTLLKIWVFAARFYRKTKERKTVSLWKLIGDFWQTDVEKRVTEKKKGKKENCPAVLKYCIRVDRKTREKYRHLSLYYVKKRSERFVWDWKVKLTGDKSSLILSRLPVYVRTKPRLYFQQDIN